MYPSPNCFFCCRPKKQIEGASTHPSRYESCVTPQLRRQQVRVFLCKKCARRIGGTSDFPMSEMSRHAPGLAVSVPTGCSVAHGCKTVACRRHGNKATGFCSQNMMGFCDQSSGFHLLFGSRRTAVCALTNLDHLSDHGCWTSKPLTLNGPDDNIRDVQRGFHFWKRLPRLVSSEVSVKQLDHKRRNHCWTIVFRGDSVRSLKAALPKSQKVHRMIYNR
jgi:ribosomal protein L37AE/L43A